MNEIAKLAEGLEKCIYCPALTRECDGAGEPVCDDCRIDREASRIDAAHDRRRER